MTIPGDIVGRARPLKSGSHSGGKSPFLHVALEMASRLANSALWSGKRCTWTGDDMDQVDGEWRVVHQTIDAFLYSGTAGVALFLAGCHRYQAGDELRETALAAIEQSLFLLQRDSAEPPPLGLYDGITGIAVAAHAVGSDLQDPALLETGHRLATQVCDRVTTATSPAGMDMVSGSAGILLGLLRLASLYNDSAILAQCRELARQMIANLQRTPYGWYWPEAEQGDEAVQGLCGFGHGAAGIAHALMEFGVTQNHPESIEAARQAIRYEQGWFSPRACNWPDLRKPDPGQNEPTGLSFPVFWCHGSAGIGLARLRAFQLTGERHYLAQAGAALQGASFHAKQVMISAAETGQPGFDANASLCHGLGSIIDLFLFAHRILANPEFLKRARAIGRFGLASRDPRGHWPCGIHGGGETPGVMLGLAGIGLNYLRLHDPAAVSAPSIVTTDP